MSEIQLLTILRAGIGIGALLAPRLAVRLLGLDAHPQLPFLARLLGIRDAALAVGLQLSPPENRSLWLQLGLVCDATDGLAGILAGRRGELSRASTVLVSAPAAFGCGLGVAALRSLERDG
jgi:hypothetical protein